MCQFTVANQPVPPTAERKSAPICGGVPARAASLDWEPVGVNSLAPAADVSIQCAKCCGKPAPTC